MIRSIITKLNKSAIKKAENTAKKAYNPTTAKISALNVIQSIDLLEKLHKKTNLTESDHEQIAHLVHEKEVHTKVIKDEINILWVDYFKNREFKPSPNTYALVHSIMLTATACRQSVNREKALRLFELVNRFSDSLSTNPASISSV